MLHQFYFCKNLSKKNSAVLISITAKQLKEMRGKLLTPAGLCKAQTERRRRSGAENYCSCFLLMNTKKLSANRQITASQKAYRTPNESVIKLTKKTKHENAAAETTSKTA